MANEKNLRPSEYKFTPEDAKKGGIASGEAKRAKKEAARAAAEQEETEPEEAEKAGEDDDECPDV